MSKKDNFSQAAYEMFGIGRGGSKREADKTAEKPAESAAMDVEEDEMSLTVAPTVAEVKPLEKVPEKPKTTLLAEGKSNRLVAYKHGEFVDYDIQEALNMKKDIPEDQYEISKLLIR